MTYGGLQTMWVLVTFDLPVVTREQRREYARFHKRLEGNGFTRIQFSVYARHCASDENADVHRNRIERWLPPEGEIRLMLFTDKQWSRMQIFGNRVKRGAEEAPEQLTFF
jgi:CRISPR-associated protein Cas2